MKKISDIVDSIIIDAVKKYDGNFECDCSFSKLIGFGELVDRLSIINFKLFTLKDAVMNRIDDEVFRAWAAVEDVKLVEERARLKKCIDEKLIIIIKNIENGDVSGGINSEVKKYGK